MSDSEQPADIPPQRLCSEIQLFDLCDLSSCRLKTGRFCSDPILLSRFEKISERELQVSERYHSSELEDSDADDDDSFAEFGCTADDDESGEYDEREE